MIRPSALQLAEKCGHAAQLAAEHPEGSEASERGKAIHAECAMWLLNGTEPKSPEGRAFAASWELGAGDSREEAKADGEVPVELRDPESNQLITVGTADVVWSDGESLYLADIKTGRPEFVEPPDNNLQLHAYALGAALGRGLDSYQVALVFLDGDSAEWVWGEPVASDMWAWLDRVRAAASKGPEPIKGAHCTGCWSRMKCKAWLLPADPAERDAALAPLASADMATPEQITRLYLAATALEEIAERGKAHVRAYVQAHGPIPAGDKELALSEVAGRRSVSVKDAEIAAPQIIKTGPPTQRLAWRNLRPHERKAG